MRAAAHLEIVEPFLNLLHRSVLEEILAVVCTLVDGNGWQVSVLQSKVLGHLRMQCLHVPPSTLCTMQASLADRARPANELLVVVRLTCGLALGSAQRTLYVSFLSVVTLVITFRNSSTFLLDCSPASVVSMAFQGDGVTGSADTKYPARVASHC